MSIAHDGTHVIFLLVIRALGSKLEPNLFSFEKQVSSHNYGQRWVFFVSTASGIHQNRQLSPENQIGK